MSESTGAVVLVCDSDEALAVVVTSPAALTAGGRPCLVEPALDGEAVREVSPDWPTAVLAGDDVCPSGRGREVALAELPSSSKTLSKRLSRFATAPDKKEPHLEACAGFACLVLIS